MVIREEKENMTREERASFRHRCHQCGQLVAGRVGVDFHYIRTNRDARYYCKECIEKMMKGD